MPQPPPHRDARPRGVSPPAGPACEPPAGLSAELGKRCPFEMPEEEAYLNVVRTADRLSRGFDRLFKRHGLSQPLYNVLRILAGEERTGPADPGPAGGGGPHGLPVRVIRDRLVAHAPDVTRLVDRLETLGLGERTRCPDDRRSVRVRLTDRGRAAVTELADPVRDLHRSQLGHLTAEQLRALSRMLEAARGR